MCKISYIFLAVLWQTILHNGVHGQSISSQNQDPSCNPPPDPNVPNYIVAYGSLISTPSKDRTVNNTGQSIPVEVRGYRREWNLKGQVIGPGTTFLGVVPDDQCTFNGVVFQLPFDNVTGIIQSFDTRESFYCRRAVDVNNIRPLVGGANNGNGGGAGGGGGGGEIFWIYVNRPEFTAPPTKNYPIVQSYVDIFLSGCLEVQANFGIQDFARNCVDSTRGWSLNHWVNDRIYPRRPFVYQPNAARIDALLHERVPQQFNNIHVEGFGLKN